MTQGFQALRLFTTNSGSRARLDVGGELDLATVGALSDHLGLLVEHGIGDVEVDMSLVTFCDLSALRVFDAAHRQLASRNRQLCIIKPSRPVVRLLQLATLDRRLLAPADVVETAVEIARRRYATQRSKPHKSSANTGQTDTGPQSREQAVG